MAPDAKFLKSAVNPVDYPDETKPEVALVGRSNAGKSSLLNAMTGAQKVAKISATPGKTRLLNFFDVGDFYRLVDLPGYGYAARDTQERELWAKMIGEFFEKRVNLIGLVLVCDVRREWTPEEDQILQLATQKGLEVACVLTKIDKLSRKDLLERVKNWVKTSNQKEGFFKPVSALKNDGVKDLEQGIFKAWIKPRT